MAKQPGATMRLRASWGVSIPRHRKHKAYNLADRPGCGKKRLGCGRKRLGHDEGLKISFLSEVLGGFVRLFSTGEIADPHPVPGFSMGGGNRGDGGDKALGGQCVHDGVCSFATSE